MVGVSWDVCVGDVVVGVSWDVCIVRGGRYNWWALHFNYSSITFRRRNLPYVMYVKAAFNAILVSRKLLN